MQQCTQTKDGMANSAESDQTAPSSWPSCSKLTMSLVNKTLKFQMFCIQKLGHFLPKKSEAKAPNNFSTKILMQ